MLYSEHPHSQIPQGFIASNTPLPYATHWFGTREGTHADSNETIRALTERFGPIAHMRQIHSAHIAIVEKPTLVAETDALITTTPGLWLAIKTADCVPILISSPKAVAAIHAGWRSTEAGILSKTIKMLCTDFHLDVADLHLALGPSLSQPHFEVEAQFQSRFPVNNPERFFQPSTKEGRNQSHLLLNLPGILKAQAQEAGILDIHIHHTARCTFTEAEVFNSYRRYQQGQDTHYATQISLIQFKGA
jgi:YfiH family protein